MHKQLQQAVIATPET